MLEKYVEDEFNSLKGKYNPNAKIKKVVIDFNNEKFFDDFRRTIVIDRRGEVGFLLKRKNGKYVIIRSRKYPKNIYRIPTGGIKFSEDALSALQREVKEELGVDFNIDNFKGLVEYEIKHENDILKFYSYAFEISEVSGELIRDATEREITGYKEVSYEELYDTMKKMDESNGPWKDWCKFRVEIMKFYLQ